MACVYVWSDHGLIAFLLPPFSPPLPSLLSLLSLSLSLSLLSLSLLSLALSLPPFSPSPSLADSRKRRQPCSRRACT
eukprot:567931-Rhodomonas_salina.1